MKMEIKFEGKIEKQYMTTNSDFVKLTPITANHNNSIHSFTYTYIHIFIQLFNSFTNQIYTYKSIKIHFKLTFTAFSIRTVPQS